MGLPKLASISATAFILAACSSPLYVDRGDATQSESRSLDRIVYQVNAGFVENPPRCIAILPFESASHVKQPDTFAGGPDHRALGAASGSDEAPETEDLAEADSPARAPGEAVRRAFYAQLSLQGREDIELGRVDYALAQLAAEERTDYASIGAALGCDALLVGSVTKYGSGFFGLYSNVSVGADVRIVRAWDGEVLWEGEHVAHSRGGSVPVSPIGIVMSIVNAASNLRGEQITRVTNDLARRLISTVPDNWTAKSEVFAGYGDPRNYRFVKAGALNLRGGPGKAYRVQYRLTSRDVVEVVGPAFNEDWVPVKLRDGRVGYVSTRYLSVRPPRQELAIAPRPTAARPAVVAASVDAASCAASKLATDSQAEEAVAKTGTC